MKNAYLKERADRDQYFFDVGHKIGMQKMWDYMQLVLRDPGIMGKDVFGAGRLEKLFQGMKDRADEYHIAFTDDKEADVKQEELDKQLLEIWGDKNSTFYERYPDLKKVRYDKSKKGWK